MGASNKTGHGDEIERWEGYVVLVEKVAETVPG